MVVEVSRSQIFACLVRAQQLDRGAGEITGWWRPRTSGKTLRIQIQIQPWARASAPVRARITEQAERLSAYRQVSLSGIDLDD